jgi:hypothetical protein
VSDGERKDFSKELLIGWQVCFIDLALAHSLVKLEDERQMSEREEKFSNFIFCVSFDPTLSLILLTLSLLPYNWQRISL